MPGRSAQLRLGAAAQHVPGFKNTGAVAARRLQRFRECAGRRHDMDQRVAVHEARVRINASNRLAGPQRGTHQLYFHCQSVSAEERAPGVLHQSGR